jgi:nitric oxide reductase subunit B
MALAGVLVSIAPLHALGAGDLTRTFGNIAVFVAPLACLILAAHSYRALSDRNPSRTLSAHWVAFGVLLILLGIGVLGALGSASEIIQWTLGTRLTDLQATLTAFATVAIVLGVINQATAELRGENRRITGLMPFWFVSFGVVGGGVALAGAGLVQVYLERILGIGYLETQTLIIPLYLLWIVGTLSMAVGVGIYALGFRARQVVVPE